MSATIALSRAGLPACPRARARPDAKRATRREVNRYNTAAEGRLTHSRVSPDSTWTARAKAAASKTAACVDCRVRAAHRLEGPSTSPAPSVDMQAQF
ncbi:hypothetical protein OH76DRAFT_1404012 [Lentinus brumalis]|uniref:Uncharacterized protein n=1 Tax=Lentinus brumalis TaxID=2498619 RepID=A0A371D992_9APHY|nr:hypothetical protein OH76DRAFT_1404012 [Polyporus brumalis]